MKRCTAARATPSWFDQADAPHPPELTMKATGARQAVLLAEHIFSQAVIDRVMQKIFLSIPLRN